MRLARRMRISAPVVGTLFALMAARAAVRRKGLLGGTTDTLLNGVPFVGAAKNLAEYWRGRDFIPDRGSAGR
jgi:hypothetical protein